AASRVAARAAVASTPRTAATTLMRGPGRSPTITQAGTLRSPTPRRRGVRGMATARASPGATETPPTLTPRAGSSIATSDLARTGNPEPGREEAHGRSIAMPCEHESDRGRHVGAP